MGLTPVVGDSVDNVGELEGVRASYNVQVGL